MPPRRYVVFATPLILFFWLMIYQIPSQSFAQAVPPLETAFPEIGTILAASPLDIQVGIVHNGPKLVGETVTFTAVVSGGPTTGLTFYWEFGDGATDKNQVTQHSYTRAGTYKVTVTASDGIHGIQAESYVAIGDLTPTPDVDIVIKGLMATGNSPTIAGNPTNFVATVLQGNNISYEWNFGDGTTQTGGSSISHVYNLPGDYPVTVTAKNRANTEVFHFWVWIFEAPPRGLMITGPSEGNINTISTFTATIDGGTNVKFEWSFSDGEIWNDPNPDPLVRKSVRSHVFQDARLHTVNVSASNSAGKLSARVTILIKDELPIIISVTSNSNGTETLVPVGEAVNFIAFVRSNTKVEGEWQWGDGAKLTATATTGTENLPIKEFRATHQYATEGAYKVTFLARNTGGVVSKEIIVNYGFGFGSLGIPRVQISYEPPQPRVGKLVTYTVPLNRDLFNCVWDFGDGVVSPFPSKVSVSHVYTMAKGYIVTAKCEQPTVNSRLEYYGDSIVYIGVDLFMPFLFDSRPTATPTATPRPPGAPGGESTGVPTTTPTETPTGMPVPTATATPTATPTQTLTPMALPTPTETPTVTETPTLIATAPEMPTETATPTPPVVETATETPTDTATPTLPAIETATETPTETPTIPGSTIPQVTPTPTPLPLP